MASNQNLFTNFAAITKYLTKNGFTGDDVNQIFVKAASDERLDVLEYLLYTNNVSRWTFRQAIEAAIKSDNDFVIHYLWNTLSSSLDKINLLTKMIKVSRIDLVIDIIEYENIRNLSQELLNSAARNNQISFIKFLMKKYTYNDKNLRLAVKSAISGKHIHVVKFLVKCGAPMITHTGYVDECALRGNLEIMVYLIEDCKLHPRYKIEALDVMIINGDANLFEYVVENGIVAITDDKNELLRTAASTNSVQIMRYLQQKGQTFSKNAFHSLSDAVRSGHIDVFRYIMQLQPEKRVINNAANCINGATGRIEIMEVLQPFRNKSASCDGWLLTNAIIARNDEFAKYLIENYDFVLEKDMVELCVKHLTENEQFELLIKFNQKYRS
jgi:hypothetical protein